jgi:hypothetical protein
MLKSQFKIIFFLVTFLLDSKASLVSQDCGFVSTQEIFNEARLALEKFEDIPIFDPWFFLPSDSEYRPIMLNQSRMRNLELRHQKDQNLSRFTWAGYVYEELFLIKQNNSLQSFNNYGLLEINISDSDGNGNECELACTDFSNYSIILNPSNLSHLAKILPLENFKKLVKGIIGHEIGHFIFDSVLFSSGVVSSYEEMSHSLNPLKYHITLDAISMLLTQLSQEEYINIYFDSSIFGSFSFYPA